MLAQRQALTNARENKIRQLRLLSGEIKRYRNETFVSLENDLRREFAGLEIDETVWSEFAISFKGDPDARVEEQLVELQRDQTPQAPDMAISPTKSMTVEQLEGCETADLKAEHDRLSLELGTDRKNSTRLSQLNTLISTKTARLNRLDEEITRAVESRARITSILEERSKLYNRFFELVIQQSETLTNLYSPLKDRLSRAKGSASV